MCLFLDLSGNIRCIQRAAVGEREVFHFVGIVRKPIVYQDAVVAAFELNAQIIARFAQNQVGSGDTLTEAQRVVTRRILDDVVTVAFGEEISIITGTTNQHVVADTAVQEITAVFTYQTVVACQAVQMVVATVAVDSIVQRVTGTVQITTALQVEVFHIVRQCIVDSASNRIYTAVDVGELFNDIAGIIYIVYIVTIAAEHDVRTLAAVQVVVAAASLQIIFTAFTVKRIAVITAVQRIVAVTAVNNVGSALTVDNVVTRSAIDGVFLFGTDGFARTGFGSNNVDDVTFIFIQPTERIVLLTIIYTIITIRFRFGFRFRFRSRFGLRFRFRFRLRTWFRWAPRSRFDRRIRMMRRTIRRAFVMRLDLRSPHRTAMEFYRRTVSV